jgi:hypothetical protein
LSIYEQSTSRIELDRKGETFSIQKGVRQGDPLSPKLFSAVLEMVFRDLNWNQYGLNIDGRQLTHLRFADDVVLFAKDSEELNKMINDIAINSKTVGLSLNLDKTKTMTNGKKNNINIVGKLVEYVDEYIYLGQIISPIDTMTRELERRTANGWKRYWSLKEVFKDKVLLTKTKGKLFNTCILPVLMYGSQTWALTKATISKLACSQRAMERSMLGVRKSDRLRNAEIRRKTKVQDISTKVRRLKWKWAGHIIRGADKWSKRVTQWYPREGKRKKGRPQKRWEDDIRQVAGCTWSRVAQDRSEWRRLEEAFAEGQTDTKFKKCEVVER